MIEATDIAFGYEPGRPIISAWTTTIESGEVVAILGPSGSGKSTLLYILGALVRPWSGSLRLGGRDINMLGDRGRSDVRAGLLGFVFQDALLDPRRSVLDNIVEGSVYRGDGLSAARQKALWLLDQLEVDVEADRQATNLSGGQAQRVAVCRALLNDPKIVLADEPTGNLDSTNAAEVESVLFERSRAGAAIVIVTHDERLAARCDRRLRL